MTRHDTTAWPVWQVELDVVAFIFVVGGLYMLHSIFVVYILGVDIFSLFSGLANSTWGRGLRPATDETMDLN